MAGGRSFVISLLFVAIIPTTTAFADDVDDAISRVKRLWADRKSFRIESTTLTKGSSSAGPIVTTERQVEEAVRAGDSWKNRVEKHSETKVDAKAANAPKPEDGPAAQALAQTIVKVESTGIFDGEFHYLYLDQNGQKSAMKMKKGARPSSQIQINPFEQYVLLLDDRKSQEIRLIPDEKVGNRVSLVFDLIPRDTAAALARRRLVYDKENGALLEMSEFSRDGSESEVTRFTHVDLDIDIPADRFIFTAPPGVDVREIGNVLEDRMRRFREAGVGSSASQPAEPRP